VAALDSQMPFLRSAFGAYGRGNGAFYYTAAVLVFLLSFTFSISKELLQFEKMMKVFSWIVAVYALMQSIGIDFVALETKGLRTTVLTLGNSNFAGGLLAVLFTWLLILEVGKKSHRISDLLLILAIFIGTINTQATQGIFVEILATLVALTIYLKDKYPNKKVLALLISFWGISLTGVLMGILQLGPLAQFFSKQSFRLRTEYWQYGIQLIRDNFWFGVGPDNIYDYSAKLMKVDSLSFTRVDNVHNWFLQIGASFGVIALISILAIIALVLLKGIKAINSKEESSPLLLPTFFAFISAITIGLVSIEQPGLGIWLYFLGGIVLGISSKKILLNTQSMLQIKLSLIGSLCVTLLVSALSLQIILGDMNLRKSVRQVMSGDITNQQIDRLIQNAIALTFQPEYQLKSIDLLAKAGNPLGMNKVSQEYYSNFPSSLQNNYVRVAVLTSLDKISEACALRPLIVSAVPWELEQWYEYMICNVSSSNRSDAAKIAEKVDSYAQFDLTRTKKGTYESVRDIQILAFNAWIQGDAPSFLKYLEDAQISQQEYEAQLKKLGGESIPGARVASINEILLSLGK
jgi:O-antigen ligase